MSGVSIVNWKFQIANWALLALHEQPKTANREPKTDSPSKLVSFSMRGLHKTQLCVALAVLMLGGGGLPATAQDSTLVPRIEDAELFFDQALEAFEDGDYRSAYQRFSFIYEHYAFNRTTTAAILMAGKALYRDGRYQQATDLLAEFVDLYPTSGYVDEAQRVRELAQARIERGEIKGQAHRLGIILPLDQENASLAQELFNGIRLAVDEQNQAGMAQPPVRMFFRDTRNDSSGARQAVRALVDDDSVDVIVGPLFSEEAVAAGAEAERARMVMVAPLATEEDVSEGRRYVFQTNPTITTRGRLMARFAARHLGLDSLGVVAELGNSLSERMAEGFQDELLRLKADLTFYKLLPHAGAWSQWIDSVRVDTLKYVDAVYLPISGVQAGEYIRDAVQELDATLAHLVDSLAAVEESASVDDTLATLARGGIRLLGNKEWHNLSFAAQVSTYRTTYTNDFYIDDPSQDDVQAFERRYRALAGKAPGRLAYVGYDVARFVIDQLARQTQQPLGQRLREAPFYQGLGTRIDFRGQNVNQAMFYHQYRNGGMDLLRYR